MAGDVNMKLQKRAVGLVAAIGFLAGMVVTAPAAHAGSLPGNCTGVQLIGALVPPATVTPSAEVEQLKTAKSGTVVWGPGQSSSVTATGGATCSIHGNTFSNVKFGAKLSSPSANCDPASTFPTIYPLNGKLKMTWVDAGNPQTAFAYIRVVDYDPVPGPDVALITGTFYSPLSPPSPLFLAGQTISGEIFIDPILKATSNGPGPVLKNQYFFDDSQLSNPCSAGGGNTVGLVWAGDGTSLLGSLASGISWI